MFARFTECVQRNYLSWSVRADIMQDIICVNSQILTEAYAKYEMQKTPLSVFQAYFYEGTLTLLRSWKAI